MSSKKVLRAVHALREYGVSSFASHADSSSIPMALIYGNHDNSDRVLGLLEAAGVASLLVHTQAGRNITLYPLCRVVGGVELVVYGLDYYKAWRGDATPEVSFVPVTRLASEDETVKRGIESTWPRARYTFLVLHQDYSDQPGRDKIDLSFVDQWNYAHGPEERIDFVYIGHEHDESPPRDGETFTLLMPGSPHRQSRKGSLLNLRQEDRNFYLLSLPLQRESFSGPPLQYCQLNRYHLLSGSLYHMGAESIEVVTNNYRVSACEHDYAKISDFIKTAISTEVKSVTDHAATLLCKRIMPCLFQLQTYCRDLWAHGQSVDSIVADLSSLNPVVHSHVESYSFYSLIAYLRYYCGRASLDEIIHPLLRMHVNEHRASQFMDILRSIVGILLASNKEEDMGCSSTPRQHEHTVLSSIHYRGLSETTVKDAILSTNMLWEDIMLPTIYAQFTFTILFKLNKNPLQHTAEEQGLLISICNSFELASIEFIYIDNLQKPYAHLYMNNRTFIEPLVFKADTVVNQQSNSMEKMVNSAEKDNTCMQVLLRSLQAAYDGVVAHSRSKENYKPKASNPEQLSTSSKGKEPEVKQSSTRAIASPASSTTNITDSGSSITIVTSKTEDEDIRNEVVVDISSSDTLETADQIGHLFTSDALATVYLVPEIIRCLQQDDGCMTKERGVGRGDTLTKQLEELRKTCTENLRIQFVDRFSSTLRTFSEAASSSTQYNCRFTSLLQACDVAESNYLQTVLKHLATDPEATVQTF